LRCWDARSQVSEFLDGELDPRAVAFLQRHLEACPTCPPLLTALVGTRDALRRSGRAERDRDSVIPPTIASRLAVLAGDGSRSRPDRKPPVASRHAADET